MRPVSDALDEAATLGVAAQGARTASDAGDGAAGVDEGALRTTGAAGALGAAADAARDAAAAGKADVAARSGSSAGAPRDTWKVDRAEALRYVGYAGQAVDASLDARIDAAIKRCERTAAPGFIWRAFPIEPAHDANGAPALRLAGSAILLQGEDIRAHLQGALECAVMACTLGLANEREARRIAADPVASTLFSAAGSSLVESVADSCEADIVAAAAARGLHTNWRYSPGYGDLPLALQPAILDTLDATRRLGMSAADGGFIVPVKSVTALVGLFDTPREGVKRSCAGCACAAHCNLRKAGRPCYR